MTEREDTIRGRDEIEDLLLEVPGPERQDLLDLAVRLSDRPVPRPGLRALIRSRLATGAEPRPANLWRLAAAYVLSGAAFLAVAALGLAGVGPLAG